MDKQFLHMQKLAGLITESEYKQLTENYENEDFEDDDDYEYDDFDLSEAFQESPDEHSYDEVLSLFENYEDEEILNAFKETFSEGGSINKNDYYDFAMDFIDDMSETSFIKANWISLTDDDIYEKAGLV
jgi:hypothetical protein